MSKFSKRFKICREARGWTQDDLAKLLKISRSTVGMYEQGTRFPGYEMQEAIADLFNVSMDYLFEREPELSEQERALIEIYQSVSPEQKQSLLEFAQFLKNK